MILYFLAVWLDLPKNILSGIIMNDSIHPGYNPVIFVDSATGKEFTTYSTVHSQEKREVDGVKHNVVHVEVTSDSHPHWTGKVHHIDAAGRIDRFKKKFGTNVTTGKRKTRKEDKAKSED